LDTIGAGTLSVPVPALGGLSTAASLVTVTVVVGFAALRALGPSIKMSVFGSCPKEQFKPRCWHLLQTGRTSSHYSGVSLPFSTGQEPCSRHGGVKSYHHHAITVIYTDLGAPGLALHAAMATLDVVSSCRHPVREMCTQGCSEPRGSTAPE
jgi:hypothetical protein